MPDNPYAHISQSPTNPQAHTAAPRQFDVAELYQGPAAQGATAAQTTTALDEKLRQAYFWIVNYAVISPHYDIEYNDAPPQTFTFGDTRAQVVLPSAQSYSSFVLMPLLNFAVRGRCLLIGGPGRGKTTSAVLMGILAGYSLNEVREAMQHGQPQMTISDLLGNPLPADLVNAQSMQDIRISWRKWLSMRVRIIDEYNRIPTRTQSALLTVMADNYAEILDHVFKCPDGAWYLTANDDAGGGTYQVIEALRDRIDVVVKALSFNMRFMDDLLLRVEKRLKPEELVPPQIIFTEQESEQLYRQILAVRVPRELLRRVEFFASQFEFLEPAGEQFEYRTKDTARLASIDTHTLTTGESGKDRLKDLGTQTRNGLSVRALFTLLTFSKAMAYFRGAAQVELEDLRQVIPFVLHDKLQPDLDAPFFQAPGNTVYRTDRISWIRKLFDLACAEYDRLSLDKHDAVADLEAEFAQGLDGLSENETRQRLVKIERLLGEWSKGRKLYGNMFDDILKLKYLHQRYTNYLRWVKFSK